MLRANSLAAAAILGASFLRAQPTVAPAASMPGPKGPGHFDAGRRAFSQGQYELTLREMMMAIIKRPSDARAREYMRQAGERLIAVDLEKAGNERQALLKGYREALERGRRTAEIWNGRLLQAKASAASGLWARAYDDAQRVLDENPGHADALDIQERAARGLASTVGSANTLTPKDFLIYQGLSLLIDQPSLARKMLADAVILEEAAQLEDERLQAYITKLTPIAPILPKIEAVRRPQVAVVPRPKKMTQAPAPLAQPGQWAFAEGMKQFKAIRYEEAIELFERALGEAPDHTQARSALLRARIAREGELKRQKAGAEKLYELGLMLYSQGQRPEALEHWRRAVALSPEHGYAARALAHAEQEFEEEKK